MWRPSLVAAAPSSAIAASPCGQQVLDDWSNDRLGSNLRDSVLGGSCSLRSANAAAGRHKGSQAQHTR